MKSSGFLYRIIFGKTAEHNYPALLTIAYVTALSLIAIFTFLSHMITNYISDAQLTRAEIIYKLRAQNTLVMDISSYATTYYNESQQFDFLFLNQSIDKLDQSYKDVNAYLQNTKKTELGKARETLYRYYYGERFLIAQKLESYISASRKFAEYARTSKSPERKEALRRLNNGTERLLIEQLNMAQSDFQVDTIDDIQSIINLQLYMSGGIIFVIFLEALFIFRPIIRRLEKYHAMIISQAFEDPLTGLGNRRYFYKSTQTFFQNLKREQKPFAVAVLDLDKFKSINDTYGHDVGDEVLKNFSKLLKAELRPSDIVCRLGGEEFVVIMGNTGPKNSIHVLDRLLERIRNNRCFYRLPNGGKGTLKYTTSIGYTIGNPKKVLPIDSYLRDADLALYQAKEGGRNQYVRFLPPKVQEEEQKEEKSGSSEVSTPPVVPTTEGQAPSGDS